MVKKILLIASLAVVAAGIGLWGLWGKENPPVFKTEKVMKGEILSSVTASGTVNAVTTVQVGTQVSGTIKDIHVDFNSVVRQGQLIAQIDPAIFDAQVAQARANLLSAQANVERSAVAAADARRTMSRQQELFAKHLVARSDVDAAETAHETAIAQLSAARAQAAQAEAALRIAETNLRYTRIVSPVNGIVVSRSVDIGQTVAASFQTPTLFTIAQDLTKMQINANVDEADIGRVTMGQAVDFTVDAYPENTFHGTVFQVRNAPITVQNVVTYDVVIKVNNPDQKLKPGMTANVSIVVETKRDILRIPKAALRFSPAPPEKNRAQRQPKGPAVWIVGKNAPKRIPVVTGVSDGDFSELVSGEISEGQEVIVESLSKSQGAPKPPPRMF